MLTDQNFALPVFPQCRGLLPELAGTTEVLHRGLTDHACSEGLRQQNRVRGFLGTVARNSRGIYIALNRQSTQLF